MARNNSTKVQWRVQVRKSRKHKWQNKGLFETREDARYDAHCHRDGYCGQFGLFDGVGFGNTRVLKYIRGEKK